ncbi:hypothetical protein PspLS_03357 [Pyricularia sp. CBS 133598]|nr:hypothetical protein PspLS_03357 [Pyricularia sp. CBS 133598]
MLRLPRSTWGYTCSSPGTPTIPRLARDETRRDPERFLQHRSRFRNWVKRTA